MAMNPDPKPGRWILPLVVLGMVAFTYFFVRALPTGTADTPSGTSLVGSDTTVPGDATAPPDTSGTSLPDTTATDPATQEYLDGVQAIQGSLEDLQREMAAVNGGFDADPRTVEYADGVTRLEALAGQADELVVQTDALSPPEALATSHETIRTAVVTAAAAAGEALLGLQSDDDGSQRRDAVTAFDTAVSDLQTAVANARSAAGLTAPATTVPPDTSPTTDTTTGG
ncbi:MAG: hypothetical protein ACRDVD_03995 [Acidimicrobiia bacterium]